MNTPCTKVTLRELYPSIDGKDVPPEVLIEKGESETASVTSTSYRFDSDYVAEVNKRRLQTKSSNARTCGGAALVVHA